MNLTSEKIIELIEPTVLTDKEIKFLRYNILRNQLSPDRLEALVKFIDKRTGLKAIEVGSEVHKYSLHAF